MGKNNKNNKNNKKKNKKNTNGTNNNTSNSKNITVNTDKYPFVSVCTPTFNRRPFIEGIIKCFNHQDYPKDRMEWIIIDDGTDKIEDLVINHPHVKYFKYDTKMKLGKKRNLLHEKSKGDIIVYMDDDDYYPPQRVSHAVQKLQEHPEALCAGSSEIYIYFKHIQKMYQFGPYGPNHATAGTFAFKRKLIENRYDDEACLAEEKSFLKDYTVPFVQLDPKKVILVFSHEHNTFDKRKLLDNPHPNFVKESTKTVDEFVKEKELKEFYMNIDSLLQYYSPGKPIMKPDVLEQMVKIEETRRKHAEQMAQNNGNGGQILVQQDGKDPIALNNNQIVELMKQQQGQLQQQGGQLQQIKQAYEQLARENMELKKQLQDQMDNITQLQKLNTQLILKNVNGESS
jgi:glycosyltransferase involved in cell wall biosynthesis